jgi:hypothetical protein
MRRGRKRRSSSAWKRRIDEAGRVAVERKREGKVEGSSCCVGRLRLRWSLRTERAFGSEESERLEACRTSGPSLMSAGRRTPTAGTAVWRRGDYCSSAAAAAEASTGSLAADALPELEAGAGLLRPQRLPLRPPSLHLLHFELPR